MKNPEKLSRHGQHLLDRRNFLGIAGLSTMGLALTSLLQQDGLLGAETSAAAGGVAPIRPDIDASKPYASRPSHFAAPAKQVLVIYCPGAVSHVDTFDYKPALSKFHGKKPPGLPTVTFEGPSGNIAKPFWEFTPRGESGKMVSDLLPHLGDQADDFCFFHALSTDTSAHPQGENFMNTGFTMEGFPSFGSWITYALGTENQELPAFVALNDPRGLARSGKNNFGNGFLPAAYQGTDFSASKSPNNLSRPSS
ncbi:MAG: DUF1501 domain-containing protein, partial [Pirellulales bacterium]|nr:DUF1501 domain-containing protein [Pirellulales bacterium]